MNDVRPSWGFQIICQHCKSPATITNEKWLGDEEDKLTPTVRISCEVCEQPDEEGAIKWWNSATRNSMLCSDIEDNLLNKDNLVTHNHYNDGSIHSTVEGSVGRGKSILSEANEIPPIGSITHRYHDVPTPS